MKRQNLSVPAALALSTALTTPAQALPGFFAGQGSKVPENDATHVVVMKKGDASAVSVMTDYKGDLKPFALVMPVPSDVTAEQVKAMRRDFVDRVDQISAPRFHEFWEMDPCAPGEPEQIWQQDRTAKSSTAFLSGGMMGLDKATRKVAKELRIEVDPEFKDSEYTFTVLDAESGAGDIAGWLKGKGYTAPPGANEATGRYVSAGMKLLVAEVDDKKVELVGGRRAILSPIRYATKEPIKVNSTLGLLNSGGKQELFIYVLHPERRFEPKGYETRPPPTNIEVDFKVKERMAEFYAGLHDLMLAKNPKTFLIEYAWPTSGCGEPCPNERLMVHELLTLGGDYFEQDVPDDEKAPDPPELTEEEKQKFDAIEDKDEKKRFEEDRKEVARRKALIERHKYVLTRMHHRYDKAGLPSDIELAPAPHLAGGVEIPKGRAKELPTDVEKADKSQLQTRYVHYHPNKAVIKCEEPKYGRWGKPPRTYRGLRKIWVVQDIARKDRDSIKPAKMVKTPIPSLGLAGVATGAGDAGADAGKKGGAKDGKDCGCRAVGAPRGSLGLSALLSSLGLGALLRRRRRPGAHPS